MAKRKTTTGGSVQLQPKVKERATVRAKTAAGIVAAVPSVAAQLRQAISQAEAGGLTRYRIAKLSGISLSIVSRLMNGQTVPTLATAERLAGAIGRRVVLQ